MALLLSDFDQIDKLLDKVRRGTVVSSMDGTMLIVAISQSDC